MNKTIEILARELRDVRQRELACTVPPSATEAAAKALTDAGGDVGKALRGEQ